MFSFNSPYGACEECEGIGSNLNVDPKLVLLMTKKACKMVQLHLGRNPHHYTMLKLWYLCQNTINFLLLILGKTIKKNTRYNIIWIDDEEIKFSYDDGYESYTTKKTFEEW